MPLERIYIARHGFRANWLSANWTSPTGLERDPPLAAFGVSQAEELATHISSLPAHSRPTAVFASPFYRCLQTATPVAKSLNVPLFVEHGIAEWYSPAAKGTGLHPRPSKAPVLRTHFPDIDPSWSSTWLPSRKGESVDEVHNRTAGFLDAFIPRVERGIVGRHHTNILLVTHAATVITLARELVGTRELALRVGCCTLSVLERQGEGNLGTWVPRSLAQGDFLSGGVLRDWGFEDIEVVNGQVVDDLGVPGSESEVEDPEGLQTEEYLAKM